MAGEKVVCTNRKAYHDYEIKETYEVGIALKGTEVKALREGKANLKDSYAAVKNGELFLFQCHISPYSHGNIENHEPLRTRKLLMQREEIKRLYGLVSQKGVTLIPLRIYFLRGKAKVELAVARGKKLFDKRESLREKDARREVERAMKR